MTDENRRVVQDRVDSLMEGIDEDLAWRQIKAAKLRVALESALRGKPDHEDIYASLANDIDGYGLRLDVLELLRDIAALEKP